MTRKENNLRNEPVTRLIFVRHGETEENLRKEIQGQRHGKLSVEGIAQIKLVAKRLKDEKIDLIISSDLDRCRHTTQEITKHNPSPVEYTAEVRERSLGIFEGGPRTPLEEAEQGRIDFTPQNGESLNELYDRAKRFLARITKEHKGKNILITSHGGFIRMAIANLLGMTVKEGMKYKIGNTAVSIFEIDENLGCKAVCVDCTKHLL